MDAEQIILSRQLPKTGQSVQYEAGDDGTTETGWWKGRLNADNKTRFIVGGREFNKFTIDRATGLMWATDGAHKGCAYNATLTWLLAIQYANELNFARFRDWRVPNVKELSSIVDYSKNNPTIDTTFFLNTALGIYWSSTTYSIVETNAWYISYVNGRVYPQLKTSVSYLRCVRGGL